MADNILPSPPTAYAVSFRHSLKSGRTRPCVFGCVDGKGSDLGEYVVKWRSEVNNGVVGLSCELIAAMLAHHLGLSVPDPAIIIVDDAVARTIPEQARDLVMANVGAMYGSRYLSGGFTTWPNNQQIPEYLITTALKAFIFDAMIENPDRQATRPNVLWKNTELFLIDHESAFAFLYALPWKTDNMEYLSQHVYHHGLSLRRPHDYSVIQSRIASYGVVWEQIERAVPEQWHGGHVDRIKEHILSIAENPATFINKIRQALT